MLSDKEIYLPRLGTLTDLLPLLAKANPEVADTTYLTNWHQAPTETMARWDHYAARGVYAALKTPLDRIQYALKDNEAELTAGKVAYRDYSLLGTTIDRTTLDGILLYDRPALAHEQTVRLYTTTPNQRPRPGLGVRVDISDLLDEIVISPRADLATTRAIRALGTTYASKVPVRPSTLLDPAR
ncbi:MAG: hypothetical protein EPO65_00710 [Dehalococcoidia bacterium]|nr:MAG: hypothetical protein EPO65_00710 [Dehalococcoidia bacterium]